MEDFYTTIEEDIVRYLALDKVRFIGAAKVILGETWIEDSRAIVADWAPHLMPKLEEYLADQDSTKKD